MLKPAKSNDIPTKRPEHLPNKSANQSNYFYIVAKCAPSLVNNLTSLVRSRVIRLFYLHCLTLG